MRDENWLAGPHASNGSSNLQLESGSRIGVIGSGPAGAFFAYFLLDLSRRAGKEVTVDLYETRDFQRPAPQGCNMCGGIISESLVQNLATEGIDLPSTVVQRGIDSYVLHTDVGSVRIETPLQEKRIGAVHRGGGPRDIRERKWGSFDGHLQGLALGKGANLLPHRVESVERLADGRLRIGARGAPPADYDLIGVAAGVNSGALKLFEGLGFGYRPPATTKTFIREYFLGEETVTRCLGSAMHVYLLDMPRLEFGALIPKGDYVSVAMLGEEIDDAMVKAFLEFPKVKARFPEGWQAEKASCQCSPRINTVGADPTYADRIVFLGDCGVTRLYKDGIGAAYRTSKAAARTAVFQGISADSFRRHFAPICRKIARDNRVGKVTFAATRVIQKLRFARRAVLRMTAAEQSMKGPRRRMSGVLWDLFTGSASYTDVFLRTLRPAFLARLAGNLCVSLIPGLKTRKGVMP